YLGRAPDPGGFNSWVNALVRGLAPESVEAAFTGSTEYFVKHGNNPASFILSLYSDLLNRVPASAEVSFWQSQLAAGVGTFQIAFAFSTSLERQEIIIINTYTTYLGRSPELGADLFWLGQFQQGMNRATFVTAIVGSTEFFLRQGGNNTNFIIG